MAESKMYKVIVLFAPTAQLLRGIAKYSRLHGPWAFYWEPPYYREKVRKKIAMQHMREWGADGIIAACHGEEELAELIPSGIPAIVSPYITNKIEGYHNIVGDTDRVAQLASEYFINRGFKRIAYCGFDFIQPSNNLGKSLASCCSANNVEFYLYNQPKSKIHRLWEHEQIILANWLKNLPKPIAILAFNDDRGRDITEVCNVSKIYVPEEIAVLGNSNIEMVCEMATPPLSSISENGERAGYQAAALLDRLMQGEILPPQTITVCPLHIVTRQSTDILAIEDRDVAAAMNYIRQNCHQMVQVNDVVNASTLSRRVLEKRFQQVVGRSIYTQIRSEHVEQVARLLIETNLSVSQIADKTGFPGIKHLARSFQDVKGMSPVAFRKTYGH